MITQLQIAALNQKYHIENFVRKNISHYDAIVTKALDYINHLENITFSFFSVVDVLCCLIEWDNKCQNHFKSLQPTPSPEELENIPQAVVYFILQIYPIRKDRCIFYVGDMKKNCELCFGGKEK